VSSSRTATDRYTYAEHREYLFALWDQLHLGDDVVLVLHDWGSALGFDWAEQHRDRVAGIAYMEAIVTL
jgi:haloalkane dehalogenase